MKRQVLRKGPIQNRRATAPKQKTVSVRNTSGSTWWKFGPSTWMLVGGLLLFNVGCFFAPSMLDDLFGLFTLGSWAWWYYPIAVVIVGFAVRWFLIYRSKDSLLENEEAKWFCVFSGATAFLLLFSVTVHRTVDLRPMLYPLHRWFAYGEFSVGAFFVVFTVLATIATLMFLCWKWVSELLSE